MDEHVEQLLRASRPEPDAGFVRSLESRLFGRPERSERRRPLLAGVALAGGLACAALALSLAGVGPLGGNDHSVQAGSRCKFVTVTRMEQVPTVTDKGVFAIDEQPVQRRVKRCS
jgi:ferric-dicitrate binding protein FerR (iron transport regulator)